VGRGCAALCAGPSSAVSTVLFPVATVRGARASRRPPPSGELTRAFVPDLCAAGPMKKTNARDKQDSEGAAISLRPRPSAAAAAVAVDGRSMPVPV
jgi:hypothetical protein